MLVLIVLLVAWLVFRAIGAADVEALASWQHSARYALVVMFIFTATAHFNKVKRDLARMVPPYFPRPLLIVYVTGVLELLGAAGLVLPEFRRLAGICLIALLIGMFIANVNAAQKGVTLRGQPPTPLWLRTPMQILFYCASLVANSRLKMAACCVSGLNGSLHCVQHVLSLAGEPPFRDQV